MITHTGPLVLHMPPAPTRRPYAQTLGRSGILVTRAPVRPGAQITICWKGGLVAEPRPARAAPAR